MHILRTPDERFANLPDYPFTANYCEVARDGGQPESTPNSASGTTLRMHYVDEGSREGDTVVLLHGEPTWSYLYRKMIPILVNAGMRVVAPDLVGFGRSDKPTQRADYSYARHVGWVTELLEQLQLRNATLFCQDWGSLIGLRIAGEQAALFARIVVANGFLPTAQQAAPTAFKLWRAFSRYSPFFPIGRIVASGCVRALSPAIRAAYDAPFPSKAYAIAARTLPALVPVNEADPAIIANRVAWAALSKWDKPFLTLFGKNDPILGRADKLLQQHVPGAKGQPHERFWGGHFVQEDRSEYLAKAVLAWMHVNGVQPQSTTS
jgi:haloalkane dehalogenase